MKIAFIGQKGIPTKTGGVERQVEDLSYNLVKLGNEVTVYSRNSYNTENIKEWKGVKIINIPSIASKNLDAISSTFLACIDLIKRKYDIIHFQSIGPASMIFLAKIFSPRTKIVFTFHCQDYHHKKWGLFARLYLKFGEYVGNKLADKTIVTSKELLRYTQDKYNNNAVYIPSSAKIVELSEANEIKKWGLEKDNYISYIGRLVGHKGVHFLIKAYLEIETDKKLVIVGDSSFTDNYVQELHSLAAKKNNIIFTGNQMGSTLEELLSNTAIFVQPSESEGLSFALLEGMAHSRPCLVSDIPANLEAISNTGISFKSGDYLNLKTKLEEMLKNPDKLKDLGESAYQRVKSKYNIEDISKKTLEIYKEVL